MTYYIGIDDAGRGPAIGPMILAGIIIEDILEKELETLGVKDSKLLLPVKRKKIGEILRNKFTFATQEATPEEIDSCANLNYLEAQKMAMIINELAEKTDEKITAIIDCPSTNIKNWLSYLEGFIIKRSQIQLRAEHKADLNYPVVSGASIIAKEKREEEVFNLKKIFGIDFGSGYPSDPKTKEFLEKNFRNSKFKPIIRYSWSTVKRLMTGEKQERLF
jgi:ribonuclease HII